MAQKHGVFGGRVTNNHKKTYAEQILLFTIAIGVGSVEEKYGRART